MGCGLQFFRGAPRRGELRYEGSKEEGKAHSCQWQSMVTVRSQRGHGAVTVRSTVRSQYGLIFSNEKRVRTQLRRKKLEAKLESSFPNAFE